ncbi:helix-turn-helix domain-containing protein [Fulvivirga ulvae]|uniref:helix-turn-helix domain-containing protein n=1 Tax=Fulvivirga ulvae TaxID=2904245 RepID=UPI001F351A97|nr:helix-turn-helix domain-containing protein [Fulvivirga ulvae]UII30413.1 helix-turn-helix domain-containing protein [Fulvivirga ulvae]
MEPSLNTWTIIFLIAAVQGFFLSIMILLRGSRVNNLLGFLVLSFSIMLLYYVTYWTHYDQLLPGSIALAQGLTYVLGPLVYFYLQSDRKNFHFNIWHFLPFVFYMFYFLIQTAFNISYPPYMRAAQVVVQCLHLLLYSTIIFWYINHTGSNLRNGELASLLWCKKIAYAFTGYSLSFLGYYVLVFTNTLKIEYDYMISVASSLFIYFIGYHGYQNPHILKANDITKYTRSSLSAAASRAILTHLKEYMKSEKPYLDSNLKLQQLAENLNLSSHHISQCINELEGQHFSDFVNQYRIHEAQLMLRDPSQAHKKIIHIALDSGFNNKVSFNNAFKKITGITPSDFRDLHLTTIPESITPEVNR